MGLTSKRTWRDSCLPRLHVFSLHKVLKFTAPACLVYLEAWVGFAVFFVFFFYAVFYIFPPFLNDYYLPTSPPRHYILDGSQCLNHSLRLSPVKCPGQPCFRLLPHIIDKETLLSLTSLFALFSSGLDLWILHVIPCFHSLPHNKPADGHISSPWLP